MNLTPAQEKIAADRHRFRVVNCGRRFGKTTLAVEEIKGKALAKPSNIAYFAPTYQQARDIAWEALKRELRPVLTQVNESRLEARTKTIKGGESIIQLRGWESIETARGQKYDFIVPDEVASYRDFWSGWHEVLRPTLTDNRGEALFISSPKGFNHFHTLYNLENKDSDYKSFHFTTYDNPYIPPDEIDKARLELTEDRFAQEYLADFRKVEGLVYKEFNRDKHLFDDNFLTHNPIVQIEYMGGVDFGFTNPCAVLAIKRDKDNHYWVMWEWYKRGQTDAAIADYVSQASFNKVYPDPESAGGVQELKNRKINIREVIKGKDSVKSGIQKVRELFLQGRLHIHNSCENLINELETYVYPEKRDMHNEEENPIKEHDHALDALRYVMMSQEGETKKEASVWYPKR